MTRQKSLTGQSEPVAAKVEKGFSSCVPPPFSYFSMPFFSVDLCHPSVSAWAGSVSLPRGPLACNCAAISAREQAMQLALPHIFSLASYADAAFCIL